MNIIGKFLAPAAIAIVAASCETHVASTPAVLQTADDETMSALSSVIAGAMGRANVEFGPGDLTKESVIAVLPPPLGPGEDRSTATPTYFDLVLIGENCFAVNRETGAQYALDGISCLPG